MAAATQGPFHRRTSALFVSDLTWAWLRQGKFGVSISYVRIERCKKLLSICLGVSEIKGTEGARISHYLKLNSERFYPLQSPPLPLLPNKSKGTTTSLECPCHRHAGPPL
jgi:hypothetical protein